MRKLEWHEVPEGLSWSISHEDWETRTETADGGYVRTRRRDQRGYWSNTKWYVIV